MADAKILALVMAGGAGNRLGVLTARRAKPAMPYGGVYRLIDIPLSNCMHSRISDVWVIQQFQPHSLNDHISNGRPWDLDRTHGGLRLLSPHRGAEEGGWYQGNADAIFRHKSFIEEASPEVVVVLSSDHVYKLDLGEVVEAHLERAADVTMVTTRVPLDEAGRFGTVECNSDGVVTGFDYKPEAPTSDVVTTEVFAFAPARLLDLLKELAAEDERDDGEGGRLKDFGHALLPRLVEEGKAFHFGLDGYWRDLGTIESYWQAHMELIDDPPAIELDDPRWPIHTSSIRRPPARIGAGARVEDSLVSPGCRIGGRLTRSVLCPGVVVEAGATVRDSVILHDAVIEDGAVVDCAVLDVEVRVAGGARVGSRLRATPSEVAEEDITCVGQGATVAENATVPGGSRLDPQ